MTTRVASSRLIGRAAELAELETALAEAAEGRPSLAFVAGESGVGKTRLLAELERRARDAGALVLAGDSVDLGGEGELPYLPLVAALRPLGRLGDPALTAPLREAVAPLLPGPGAAAPDPQSGADPGSQGRLFEGLLSLLDALGQERPVLLVIEDLHWADRSTRAALAFLSRSLSGERVLVVGSYRPDELHPRHPLRPLRAELERDPRSRRIPLEPLSRDELAAQLEDILGAPPAPELLERLWARSGGNPLFGEELLAAGLDGRGAAPDTLRDALMLRVERLSETAQELLRLVAVAERIDHPLLEQTSGLRPRELRDALREAVDGHILVAQDDGMYRFRHALLREVVEGDLLPGDRSELHLTLARGLELRLEAGSGGRPRPPSPTTSPPPATSPPRWPPRCAPPAPPSACTPTARRRRCSTARSSCGTGCPTPRRGPGSTASPCSSAPARSRGRSATRAASSRCSRQRSRASVRSPNPGAPPGSWSRPPARSVISTARDRASTRSSARSSWSSGATTTEIVRPARACSPAWDAPS